MATHTHQSEDTLNKVGLQSKINQHTSVLLEEAVGSVITDPHAFYVDATYGRGGHSQAILNRLTPEAELLVIDKDANAIAHAQDRYAKDKRVSVVQGNFVHLAYYVQTHNQENKPIKGVLFDLGVSSPQLDDPTRGFSFHQDGPLDMRMDRSQDLTALAWLKSVSETEIADVLWQYGEERQSRKIAKRIKQALAEEKLDSTLTLAQLITEAIGRRPGKKHPATRTFQALRIQINQELRDLPAALQSAFELLTPGGRMVVISFHSLEDRIVKHFIKEKTGLKLIAKIKPDRTACLANRRARSALMRVAELVRFDKCHTHHV